MAGIDSFTKLMLHMNGADTSTTFTDSSSSNKTMTAVGNAQIDTAQFKFGGASGLFDGTGDYVTAADSADWDFSNGAFTVDCWVRFAAVAGGTQISNICGHYTATGDQRSWLINYDNNTNRLQFNYSLDGTNTVTTLFVSWTPSLDTWYHLAVERDTVSVIFFVDGVQTGAVQSISTDTIFNSTSLFAVGASGEGVDPLNGWVDELRVSKGIARYLYNFTPPVAAYVITAVQLLMHFDGTDGSTTFTDSSDAAHTMTAAGNAQLDTAQFKFGTASGLFDGTGDYVSSADSSDWDFAAGNFTVDCWVRFASVATTQTFFGQYDGSTDQRGWALQFEQASGVLRFLYSTDGINPVAIDGTWAPAINTWYHVAAERFNGRILLFVDGVNLTRPANSATFHNSTAEFSIGVNNIPAPPQNAFNGHIDELRIIKGTGFYTANFTPPTVEYTSAGNSFLMLFE